MKTPPLFEALGEAFIDPHTWYDTDKVMDVEQQEIVETKIHNIITHMTRTSREGFFSYFNEICFGYNVFLHQYVTTLNLGEGGDEQVTDLSIPMETVYKDFWENHHNEEEMSSFIDFFEHLMVKSYSEAICESIGSIMNIACGTGRVLYPDNYAKEIFLRFNLPPMHELSKNFIPELVKNELSRKRFYRKGDSVERQQRKLKYSDTSATIGNFRVKEDEKFLGLNMNY